VGTNCEMCRRPRRSCATIEVLAKVAYEQPVSRADASHPRRTDSAASSTLLLARNLIAEDASFGERADRSGSPPIASCS